MKGTRNTSATINTLPLDLGFYVSIHYQVSGLLGELADCRSRAGTFYAKKGKICVDMSKGYGNYLKKLSVAKFGTT